MNKTNLKRYAPQARKDFIATVTGRAQLLGLSLGTGADAGNVMAEPCTVQGDVALIAGRAWPARVLGQRDALLQRMRRDGYFATLEAVAYTWFNRLAALRFMELHDYLGHGRRVLSNPEGGLPEVLAHALDLAESGNLPGLQADKVRELKLANHDGELYRRVLLAQCNALNSAMPFLFEQLDDETELLLPDNLLLSDSIVAKLVTQIPEEDWSEVESIGWLYQFYISEKKDEVIGKVVKSEDIPAATQLFTPNWIVQYLVQNSVGRLWLMANPGSTLASQWPYYIQPAEQTPEVQAQLDALILTRVREDGEALNPETITVLDPACGSGHILVVAYDVLKAIYLERGYQPRAIPRLILEKNLYGLDIDDRAAQLAAFALLMKARADDRRLFVDPPKLNVLSLQESKGLDAEELATHLAPFGLQRAPLQLLVDTFEHAKTFGSLIQIPAGLSGQLAAMTAGLQQALHDGDLYARQAAEDLLPLVWQALVLAMEFDGIIANPPYMGQKGMNLLLKGFGGKAFEESKLDLFAMFMERGLLACKRSGFSGMITMQSWMFLSSFRELREKVLRNNAIVTLAHLGARAFGEISGEVVQTTAFVLQKRHIAGLTPTFFRLIDGDEMAKKAALLRGDYLFSKARQDDFIKIPGSPIAYWVSHAVINTFSMGRAVENYGDVKRGMTTSNNSLFLRFWPEVSIARTMLDASDEKAAHASMAKWFPYSKGGGYRRWYGYLEYLINWEASGRDVIAYAKTINSSFTRTIVNISYYFRPAVGFPYITTGPFGVRWIPPGCLYDSGGPGIFVEGKKAEFLIACMNSSPAALLLGILNPTVNLQIADVIRLPLPGSVTAELKAEAIEIASELVKLSKVDWDLVETSWHFTRLQWVTESDQSHIAVDWQAWSALSVARRAKLQALEEVNNRLFINAYGLHGELDPKVPEDQITLALADREKDCQRLISYAVGCMMGRYSLNEPGLIYAHAGNIGFDLSRYDQKFPADADGIVPLTEDRWFEDDAASRVSEFLRAVWGAETLEENKAWLAESLGTKGNETPDETLRRYLATKFFKDHLQTYKKRPIYWLFSSGKQGAFQALVYLHRYHEGTLARLRAEYVLPLTGKMQARIASLQADIRAASSTPARNKLSKQLESLRKQQLELLAYDEKLRHYADMRISLNLDDGVKVNYGKFGDLLAEVKAVTGGANDE